MTEPSIQQRLFPNGTCFGCGPANPEGLRLASFPQSDHVLARFTPWPQHDNGVGFLNGGIIATVLDCHSGAAAFDLADRRGWLPPQRLSFGFVTAGLDVRFRRPAMLDEACELRAFVLQATEDRIDVRAELWWGGTLRADATSEWRRWKPRPPATTTEVPGSTENTGST